MRREWCVLPGTICHDKRFQNMKSHWKGFEEDDGIDEEINAPMEESQLAVCKMPFVFCIGPSHYIYLAPNRMTISSMECALGSKVKETIDGRKYLVSSKNVTRAIKHTQAKLTWQHPSKVSISCQVAIWFSDRESRHVSFVRPLTTISITVSQSHFDVDKSALEYATKIAKEQTMLTSRKLLDLTQNSPKFTILN